MPGLKSVFYKQSPSISSHLTHRSAVISHIDQEYRSAVISHIDQQSSHTLIKSIDQQSSHPSISSHLTHRSRVSINSHLTHRSIITSPIDQQLLHKEVEHLVSSRSVNLEHRIA
jgi:hypothetical protein